MFFFAFFNKKNYKAKPINMLRIQMLAFFNVLKKAKVKKKKSKKI